METPKRHLIRALKELGVNVEGDYARKQDLQKAINANATLINSLQLFTKLSKQYEQMFNTLNTIKTALQEDDSKQSTWIKGIITDLFSSGTFK